MNIQRLTLVVVGVMLLACGNNVTWVDVPIRGETRAAFRVQDEYVRDPVHGFVARATVERRARERVVYGGKVVAVFEIRSEARARTFWATPSYLYTWFRFLNYDKNGEEANFGEFIGRFDPRGTFQVCKDITPIQDRYLTLMFSGVVDDTTFRFARATGSNDNLEHLLVKISDCRTADLKKWLKRERKGGAVSSSLAAPPLGRRGRPSEGQNDGRQPGFRGTPTPTTEPK